MHTFGLDLACSAAILLPSVASKVLPRSRSIAARFRNAAQTLKELPLLKICGKARAGFSGPKRAAGARRAFSALLDQELEASMAGMGPGAGTPARRGVGGGLASDPRRGQSPRQQVKPLQLFPIRCPGGPAFGSASSAGGGIHTPDARIMIARRECGGVRAVTGFGR
jgi:hypothetical protein